MKENKVSRTQSAKKTAGKGFYIALSLSLVAIGGATFIGINSAMNSLTKNNEDKISTQNTTSQVPIINDEWSLSNEAPVNKSQSDVPANTASEKEVTAPTAGGFIYPVRGEIKEKFSGENLVKSITLDEWVMHTGIDILSKESTPVKACSNGIVVDVWNDELWGGCVKIQHANNISSYYYNLKSAVNVSKNQEVKLGDVIGSVGKTAQVESALPSHLHFAMQENEKWIDPLTLIK